jgi:hypothetical protein
MSRSRMILFCGMREKRGGVVAFILGSFMLLLLFAACSDDSNPMYPSQDNGACVNY